HPLLARRGIAMLKRALFIFSAVTILAACGSSSVSTGTGGSTGSTGTGGTGTSGSSMNNPQTYSVSWGPITVMPGQESTQCVVKKLPNPTAFHAGSIHNQLHAGSHHMIVYRTNDTMEQPTPFPCQPFTDLAHPEKGTPLMVSQKADDLLTLPQG